MSDVQSYRRYTQGDRVGGYTLDAMLGAGRFGVVFKARKTHTCAIKVPRHFEEAVESLDDEKRVLTDLAGSPHIVALLDAMHNEHGHTLLAIELIDGGDADSLLRELRHTDAFFTPAEQRLFHAQLLDGLAWIHSKGYSHADIKPDNLLIDRARTHIKYCDVGHATKLQKPTYNEAPCVTLYYRAPEVVLDRAPFSTATDVWALACTLFELSTRYPLFDVRFEESESEETDESEETGETQDIEDTEVASEASSKVSDTWESVSGDSSDSDDSPETTILHLARMHALLGDFVPRRVRRREREFYNARGELRGGRRFRLDREPMAQRLAEESNLGADAAVLAEMLLMALAFGQRDRAVCAAMRKHAWLT